MLERENTKAICERMGRVHEFAQSKATANKLIKAALGEPLGSLVVDDLDPVIMNYGDFRCDPSDAFAGKTDPDSSNVYVNLPWRTARTTAHEIGHKLLGLLPTQGQHHPDPDNLMSELASGRQLTSGGSGKNGRQCETMLGRARARSTRYRVFNSRLGLAPPLLTFFPVPQPVPGVDASDCPPTVPKCQSAAGRTCCRFEEGAPELVPPATCSPVFGGTPVAPGRCAEGTVCCVVSTAPPDAKLAPFFECQLLSRFGDPPLGEVLGDEECVRTCCRAPGGELLLGEISVYACEQSGGTPDSSCPPV